MKTSLVKQSLCWQHIRHPSANYEAYTIEKEIVVALIGGGVAIIVALIGFFAKRSTTPVPNEAVKEESNAAPSNCPSIQQENSDENAVQIGTASILVTCH